MKIEEAKQELHNIAFRDIQTKPYDLKFTDVIKILDKIELDQPEIEVPQFVADWYERNKYDLESEIFRLIINLNSFEGELSTFQKWFMDNEDSIQTLINMHQFGYTVPKEKLYTVVIPNPHEKQLSYVLMRRPNGNVIINVVHSSNLDLLKTDNDLQLTEQEIRKDFEWAWQQGFAKEVTE